MLLLEPGVRFGKPGPDRLGLLGVQLMGVQVALEWSTRITRLSSTLSEAERSFDLLFKHLVTNFYK